MRDRRDGAVGPPVPVMTATDYTALDEELLRLGQRNARVATLSDSSLSVGVSQRDDARCIQKARELDIPVVRRSTGGLGVWHAPGDVVWSIILPRSDTRVGRDFSKAYARLGTATVRFLNGQGVSGAWAAPTGPPSECCLLSGQGAVLRVSDRTLGGAAQHITRDALLHHGVLPYRLDPARLQELFGLSRAVVNQHLTSLVEVLGARPATELARELGTALAAEVSAGRD